MDSTNRVSLFVSIPKGDMEILNAISARTGRTRSELVLEALRRHFAPLALAYSQRLHGDAGHTDGGDKPSGGEGAAGG